MKHKSLIALTSSFLSLAIVSFVMYGVTKADADVSEEKEAHPYGEQNVVIDYVECDDKDTPSTIPFDDSTKYDYNNINFNIKKGSYSMKSGAYVAKVENTLLVDDTTPFPYGTYSCDITGTTNSTDEGIVFAVNDNGKTSYWEDKNIYYYFFFLGHDGYLALGKVSNTTWTSLYSESVGSFSSTTTYNLKVILKNNFILLYMNDVLKFKMKDAEFTNGTKFGIRSGVAGASFSNFHLTNDYEYGEI